MIKLTTTAISIHLDTDNPVYGESVTRVTLEDEAGGFFENLPR